MSVEIRVPSVGESVSEATVLRWLKKQGDPVTVGEEIVELETDKANTAISSDAAGVLERIVRQEGEIVHVNDVLAVLSDSAGAGAPPPVESPAPQSESALPTENGRPHPKAKIGRAHV